MDPSSEPESFFPRLHVADDPFEVFFAFLEHGEDKEHGGPKDYSANIPQPRLLQVYSGIPEDTEHGNSKEHRAQPQHRSNSNRDPDKNSDHG